LPHACLDTLVAKGEIIEGTKEFKTYRAYCDQLGLAAKDGAALRPMATEREITMQALKKMGCDVTDDSVLVKGHLDTYIVNRRSREIRRLRDGVLLKIAQAAKILWRAKRWLACSSYRGPRTMLVDCSLWRGR
jgi:hypothetical protein